MSDGKAIFVSKIRSRGYHKIWIPLIPITWVSMVKKMKKSVIIVAGGSGTRMGNDQPKQFLPLGNFPVLMWSIKAFLPYDPTIELVVVLPEEQIEFWRELCKKHNFNHPYKIASGGETRFHSVKNGLSALNEPDLVAIHDGARPLVSLDTIRNCFDEATRSGAAVPALPVCETLREGIWSHSATVDRNRFFTIQTPQVFRYTLLQAAYQQPWEIAFTDDASVVEKLGVEVTMVPGNRDNLKITYPEDLVVAELFLKSILH